MSGSVSASTRELRSMMMFSRNVSTKRTMTATSEAAASATASALRGATAA